MRQLVGGRAIKDGAASASAMGRFETEMLTQPDNLNALADLPGRWIDAVHDKRPPKVITLDMDSSESPVHGAQEGSAWNGHFQSKCLHPLFVFNQFGDLERCCLRPGNVHSADGWQDVLRPVLARYSSEARPSIKRRRFRADAAFAIPALFELLEAEGWDYAIRIKGNPKLHDRIDWLTKRGPGRPPHHVVRHYASFHYRAKSWSKPRRVVAKVEFHPGELFPRVGFIVTNRSLPNERVLAFYNGRGTAEQHIKEGKYALKWTRLSCMKFAANAVRLQLHALAYNLANFLRTLAVGSSFKCNTRSPLGIECCDGRAMQAPRQRGTWAISAEHERGRSQRAIGQLPGRPARTIGRALARGRLGARPCHPALGHRRHGRAGDCAAAGPRHRCGAGSCAPRLPSRERPSERHFAGWTNSTPTTWDCLQAE
jgi:hypothetical protein